MRAVAEQGLRRGGEGELETARSRLAAVGIVPSFLASAYAQVTPLTEPLAECETDLWLLAHPESRHLRRIAVVAAALAQGLRLE